jgi:septum formation protein
MSPPCLILASSSPRRREILNALGLDFETAPVDIDETPSPAEEAAALVVRLAREKALAGRRNDRIVLAADTEVVLDGEIFGKPGGEEEAVGMLLRLSGREHQVLTGVAVCRAGSVRTALSRTRVRFRDVSRDEALDYWHSGEPKDKAGAYGIQGLGGVFVSNIEGSYSGVVGLPVYETARLLAGFGIDITGIATEREE